jgi:flagellar biosynthesis protein FlhB
MAESNVDKKHAPSKERLRQARKRGEVPHARDTVSGAAAVVAVLVLLAAGAWARDTFSGLLDALLALLRHRDPAEAAILALRVAGFSVFPLIAVVVAVPALAALVVAFAVTGPVFSAQPLTPQLQRVNPVAGFGRIFSAIGLFNVAKGLVGVVVLVAVALALIASWLGRAAALWHAGPAAALVAVATMLGTLVGALTVTGLVLSIPDLMINRWQFKREHRMDDAELKREHRDQDGDPAVKAELRRQQREAYEAGA